MEIEQKNKENWKKSEKVIVQEGTQVNKRVSVLKLPLS